MRMTLLLAHAMATALACASPAAAQPSDSTDRMVKVGRYAMRVRTAGFAKRQPGTPAIVLEAGGGQTSDTWGPLFANIATFAPVVAYDRRGLGKSEWDSIPPTPESFARTMHAMLESAGIAPPYIVAGHSLGGAYVRLFTAL